MRNLRNAYWILVEEAEGTWSLGRRGLRCDNIKVCLRDVSCENVDQIQVRYDTAQWQAVANKVMTCMFVEFLDYLNKC